MKKYLRIVLLSAVLLGLAVWLFSPTISLQAQGPASSTQSVVVNAANTTVLVAGVPGKRIRVLAVALVANSGSTVTWSFETSTGPAQLTGNLYLISAPLGADGRAVATTVLTLSPNPFGWFQTEPGDSLILKNASGTQPAGLGGVLVYDTVNP